MDRVLLDHCVIHVSEWQRSNRFYEDVMGAEIIPIGAGFTYRFGETQLNCHGPGVEGTPNAAIPVEPGGSDLCFIWPERIESAIAHLAANEVQVEVGPVERFGSRGYGISVYFRDPDNSLLEFISYIR
jgi:catechol 2,3-dioxygenase-like lactoylglutathione lyase family enzyme